MIAIKISATRSSFGEYADAVAEAGAVPELLDWDLTRLDEALQGAAGVLLSGGGDVDPRHYGSVTALADGVDPARDAFEIALFARARERGLPTLCICRGMQLANVALGGTLVPDIATAHGERAGALHRRIVDGRSYRDVIAEHQVAIVRGSLLAEIAGESTLVTGSRHHQSLGRIAPELRVVASTEDGIVEAVEATFESPFWLGVQWHPESTRASDGGASRAIFARFTAAAGAQSR